MNKKFEQKGMTLVSWKSIKMQVSLPKTHDAGKLQNQLLKHSQHFHESLAESQLKQEELKRKRINEFERISNAEIKDEGAITRMSSMKGTDPSKRMRDLIISI